VPYTIMKSCPVCHNNNHLFFGYIHDKRISKWRVECSKCKLFGPWSENAGEARRFWNELERIKK